MDLQSCMYIKSGKDNMRKNNLSWLINTRTRMVACICVYISAVICRSVDFNERKFKPIQIHSDLPSLKRQHRPQSPTDGAIAFATMFLL